jgi:hypothetical protein
MAVLAGGCADEFAAYNLVRGSRLLGIRAVPPELAVDETTTLDALITAADARFAWSWCPFTLGSEAGGGCAISEAELQMLADAVAPGMTIPPYDLGSDPTASFTSEFTPEFLAAICQALSGPRAPDGAGAIQCAERFPITIRLEVRSGDSTITAVRELGLLAGQGVLANANPSIAGAQMIGPDGAVAADLMAAQIPVVPRGVEYQLMLDVPESAAERYEDPGGEATREILTATWFFESGEMRKARSSFIEGVTDLANLGENQWTAPAAEGLTAARTRLFIVLRDDRGGLDWLATEVELR